MCASVGLKCCDCAPFKTDFRCCAETAPLGASAKSEPLEVEHAKVGDEYLICACFCDMCTMYVPETYTDAFGVTDKSVCCCCENDTMYAMLPYNVAAYDMLLLTSGPRAR